MGNICENAQDNLWDMYREYLWEPNNMKNIWVICGEYLCELKIAYGLVWVFFCERANDIRAQKFVPQQSLERARLKDNIKSKIKI